MVGHTKSYTHIHQTRSPTHTGVFDCTITVMMEFGKEMESVKETQRVSHSDNLPALGFLFPRFNSEGPKLFS